MLCVLVPFAGSDGVAAPRLRDANLPPPRLRAAYTEMVCIVRTLYQKCRLVHADLSEYNILYHEVSCVLCVCTSTRMLASQADKARG